MWAQSIPDVLDDASTLLDPSVALDEQSQKFQPRKQTGPKTAFLINEVLLSKRDALDNGFETKVVSDPLPRKLLRLNDSVSHFDSEKIL